MTRPFDPARDARRSPIIELRAYEDSSLHPVTSDEEYTAILLPATIAICGTCDGRGHHSLRIGAITSSEWRDDWDEDSRELYLSGGMDERCDSCNGTGRVVVVDRDAASLHQPIALAEYDRQLEEEREDAAMRDSERRAEMGMAYYHD